MYDTCVQNIASCCSYIRVLGWHRHCWFLWTALNDIPQPKVYFSVYDATRWHFSCLHTLLSFGILMWTPARNPVPRLEGQVKMYPRCSFHINSQPRSLINFSTCRKIKFSEPVWAGTQLVNGACSLMKYTLPASWLCIKENPPGGWLKWLLQAEISERHLTPYPAFRTGRSVEQRRTTQTV